MKERAFKNNTNQDVKTGYTTSSSLTLSKRQTEPQFPLGQMTWQGYGKQVPGIQGICLMWEAVS